MISDFERELCQQIAGRNALDHIEKLCELGDRFVGTAGDLAALEYMVGQFRQFDLKLDFTEIEVPTYQQHRVELRLLDPDVSLSVIPAYFTPSTTPEGLVAESVFVGGGQEEDYAGKDVRGRIVVLQEAGLGFSMFWLGTFAQRAARYGALALIVIHPMPWPYRMTLEAGNSEIKNRFVDPIIPAVCTSAVDGGLLMKAIGEGGRNVFLQVQASMPLKKSSVVTGRLVGNELPDERVGLIAHRDNGIEYGANDNASGCGTLLEIVRVLTKYRHKRSIEFISTTAEEGATVGAWSYVQKHLGDLSQLKAVIDLDMFGTGGRVNLVEVGLWPDTEPIVHTEWLMKMVEEIALDLGYYLGRMTATWGVAESARFITAGVPSIWYWKADDPYYHSIHDTPDKIDPICLKAVGDISAIAAWRLAND